MENVLIAATSDENTQTRMAKSNRSRNVIYDSGGHLNPTVARMSEAMDGDGIREPEYEGGVGGASEIRRSTGTTAVDMMANTRIDLRVSEQMGDSS